MRTGLYCSIVLHLCIVLLMFVGVPLMVRDVSTDYAIVAEVVPLSELTNIKVKSSEKIAEKEKETQKPSKAMEEPKAEEKKEVKNPEPKAKEISEAEKIPDKNVKTKNKSEPVKEDKKKKKKDDDFAKSILKSLEQENKKTNEKKLDKDFKDLEKSLKGETNKEYNPNIPMSISEIDGIKSQITEKWNTASFSGSSEMGMQVVVRIELDMDGQVINARPIADNNSSPYYRAFVESAIRAVKSASPIKNLSKDKYHIWKEIEFRFDSSGMIY